MNPARASLIVIVSILGLCGLLRAPSIAAPLYQHPEIMSIDLAACEERCRSRWGVQLYGGGYGGGRSGAGVFYGLARCYAKCNRRYWKEFDKESDELFD
jgi:hypothetical protein